MHVDRRKPAATKLPNLPPQHKHVMSVISLLFILNDISSVGFTVLVAVNIKTGLLGVTQSSLMDVQF